MSGSNGCDRTVLGRRALLVTGAAALAGCSVVRDSPEKRLFTLDAARPDRLPARLSGRVIVVRPVQPGPGADQRGIVTRGLDGSLRTDFYAEFLTTPDVLVGDALRRWLEGSGLFAAVVDPGSRLPADLALEPSLTVLEGQARTGSGGVARITLGVLLIDLKRRPAGVLRQAVIEREVPLGDLRAPTIAGGLNAALAAALSGVETTLAPLVA